MSVDLLEERQELLDILKVIYSISVKENDVTLDIKRRLKEINEILKV